MQTLSVDRDLVIGLTQDLIRFRSVNPPGDEQPAADFLTGRMRELGIEAEVQPVGENRANVIGRIRGQGDGHLVFQGHLDVVPPGGQAWEHDPFGADLVDGRLYGRGSADMKGGVAAIVAGCAALVRSGFKPRADIIIAATAGEEAGGVGAQVMVDQRSLAGSRYLVVAEPTDLNVFIGEKGVFWVHLRTLGRTAHGSMPHLGANAVSAMARIIPQLETYPFPFEESPLLGKPSLSVNVIEGGNKTNVVPDVCDVSIDMRTVPSQDHEALKAAVLELAERTVRQYNPAVRVELDMENDKPPVETERDHPLVEAMIQAVRAVRGSQPEVGGVPYGTDAAFLGPGFDIPMVICGPGAPGMAHQPDEWVLADQLVEAAEIYAEVARILLS